MEKIEDVDVEEIEEVEFVEKGEEEEVKYISEDDVKLFAEAVGIDMSVFNAKYQTMAELRKVVLDEKQRLTNLREATQVPEPKTVVVEKVEPDYDAFNEALSEINRGVI